MMKKSAPKSGFTLIEILVVIGIIAIIATVVLIAINPARQFALARNSQREANVRAILDAVGQNMADNKGNFTCPGGTTAIPSTNSRMQSGGSGAVFDIAPCIVPDYIPALPFDPSVSGAHWGSITDYDTAYMIQATSTGRVTICAPSTNEPNTSVRRDICITR